MNTPSHSILNVAILDRPNFYAGCTWPILVGSWMPDAALFVFYAWGRLSRIPPVDLWRELYFHPVWQDIFAIGNSIPLALIGLGVFSRLQRPAWAALFASMLLHHLEDLPLHHDDAHRHFWPLSDYRFISPVSYWDPAHLGRFGALTEGVLTGIASIMLLRRVRSPWARGSIVLVNSLYLMGYLAFYLARG